jgi:hypothetical protein
MKDYKEGDITPNGWEVVSVNYRPQYKMKKRIKIITDYDNLKDVLAYYYFDSGSGFKWIETDGGRQLRLREEEFEFVN